MTTITATTTIPPQPTADHLLARHAPRLALAAGSTLVAAQFVMLPFDPKDHIVTSQSVQFQIGGVAYLAGFYLLVFALFGLHSRQRHVSGRLGAIGAYTAIVGTLLLGGDLWFETFVTPWLADTTPQAFDSDPTLFLGLGAIASYVTFAVGWALFGIASFRARTFPRSIAVAIAVAGVVGFSALLAPFGIPLGIAVAALGAWLAWSERARRSAS